MIHLCTALIPWNVTWVLLVQSLSSVLYVLSFLIELVLVRPQARSQSKPKLDSVIKFLRSLSVLTASTVYLLEIIVIARQDWHVRHAFLMPGESVAAIALFTGFIHSIITRKTWTRLPSLWLLLFFLTGSQFVSLITGYTLVPSQAVDHQAVLKAAKLSSLFLSLIFVSVPALTSCSAESEEKKRSGVEAHSPRSAASAPSLLTFFWTIPLAFRSWTLSPNLTLPDQVNQEEDFTEDLHLRFRSNLRSGGEDGKRQEVGLIRAIWKSFGNEVLIAALLKLGADVSDLAKPLLLFLILSTVTSDCNSNCQSLELMAFTVFLCIMHMLCTTWYADWSGRTGSRVRQAVVASILDKSLNMCACCRTSVGQAMNLQSVDAYKLESAFDHLHTVWSAPLTYVLASLLLYQQIGLWPVLAAGVTLTPALPVVRILYRARLRITRHLVQQSDERTTLMHEILDSMSVIKLNAWEPAFVTRIMGLRSAETATVKRLITVSSLPSIFFFSLSVFVMLITTAVLLIQSKHSGTQLTVHPVELFTCFALIHMMVSASQTFPYGLRFLGDALSACSRIQHFLSSRDQQDYVQVTNSADHDVHCVCLTGAVLSRVHEPESEACITSASALNLRVPHGSLTAVIGAVGSGKSHLLSAIMGQLNLVQGTVSRSSSILSVAFVPQEAWILNDSVRNNITFSDPFMDKERYEDILGRCQLFPDLELMPSADQTVIGEKGVSLSGGQKQRISVARAAYSDADLFLLDDPLSALDAHVSKHLFRQVISSRTGILRTKTRILVTNDHSVLPFTDHVVVMADNRIVAEGTCESLIQSGFIHSTLSTSNPSQDGDDDQPNKRQRHAHANRAKSDTDWRKLTLPDENSGRKKLSTQLLRQVILPAILIVLSMLLSQVCEAGSLLTIMLWSLASGSQSIDGSQWLAISLMLALLNPLLQGLGNWVLRQVFLNTADHVHHSILSAVMGARISFFEATPIAAIVDRFGKDLSSVDYMMHHPILISLSHGLRIATILLITTIAVPRLLVTFVLLLLLFLVAERCFNAAIRAVTRLESVYRTRVRSVFSETWNGYASIRGFGWDYRFMDRHCQRADQEQVCSLTRKDLIRGRAFAVYLISNSFLVATTAHTLFTEGDKEELLIIGAVLVYVMRLPSGFNSLVDLLCSLESEGESVHRLMQAAGIPSEESAGEKEINAPDGWPTQGTIDFQSYSAAYGPRLEPAVLNLNLVIGAGQKVGIVGRTGAGKSTICRCLMQMIDWTDGKILIDGLDISTVPLSSLRSGITVVPQDPVLFSGTVRHNLDPENRHTDQQIWQSLEAVSLHALVAGLSGQLSHLVNSRGSNFSLGQRQLLCLSRALLKGSKILVLDEATAAVDPDTDSLIQAAIRTHFSHCTVLTIAHRISSILDSDRVLVMADGRIAEMDEPSVLLRNPTSLFHSLALDAGILV